MVDAAGIAEVIAWMEQRPGPGDCRGFASGSAWRRAMAASRRVRRVCRCRQVALERVGSLGSIAISVPNPRTGQRRAATASSRAPDEELTQHAETGRHRAHVLAGGRVPASVSGTRNSTLGGRGFERGGQPSRAVDSSTVPGLGHLTSIRRPDNARQICNAV